MSATTATAHDADILFAYVIAGGLRLTAPGRDPFDLAAGDAMVIPPDLPTLWDPLSPDLDLLCVTLARP